MWGILSIVFILPFAHAELGLDVVHKRYSQIQGVPLEITNFPSTRTQDSLGNCYSFAASTILDYNNCVAKKLDCSRLPDSERVSTLDITRYAQVLPAGVDGTKRANYVGILPTDRGSVRNVIYNTLRTGEAASESCASFDQALTKIPGDQVTEYMMNGVKWSRLEQTYELVSKKSITPEEGFVQLKKVDLCRTLPQSAVLQAFSATSYEKFAEQILIPPQCESQLLKLPRNLETKTFPFDPQDARNYAGFSAKIKTELDQQPPQPISVGFCAEKIVKARSMSECQAKHAVTIIGMKTMCAGFGDCVDMVKVKNSWGGGWEKHNNDGWVNAKTLLDRTFYDDHSLTYVESK